MDLSAPSTATPTAPSSPQTPLMQQFFSVKSRYPDALVLFRMGDFYELFCEDAVVAAKVLDIALTSRNKNDPEAPAMCGVPHHAAQNYIQKLVHAGHKVALCEQMEDPALAKGLVKRDVVRVYSPGCYLEDDGGPSGGPAQNHWTLCVHSEDRRSATIWWAQCDFSTGRMIFGHGSFEAFQIWIQRETPTEIIYSQDLQEDHPLYLLLDQIKSGRIPIQRSIFMDPIPSHWMDLREARRALFHQFETQSLTSIHHSLSETWPGLCPLGALIQHFQSRSQAQRIPGLIRIEGTQDQHAMVLDPGTLRALDVLPEHFGAGQPGQKTSLFHLLHFCETAAGSRLLRQRLMAPLLDMEAIEQRLDDLERILPHAAPLGNALQGIYDFERILARIGAGTASPRDLLSLSLSIQKGLRALDVWRSHSGELKSLPLALSQNEAKSLQEMAVTLENILVEQPPSHAREGGIFAPGAHPDLDELLSLQTHSSQWLLDYEAQEKKATGISSLKVRFNRVFGYYIEVTKTNLDQVPLHYVRKQTLATAERFITEELKTFEDKILSSERNRIQLESQIFQDWIRKILTQRHGISVLAGHVASCDVLQSLAKAALEHGLTRPRWNLKGHFSISQGRHLLVAKRGGFVANDFYLQRGQTMILTGPNMGGKSTVMRQVALISLMAQMGCYIPAERAEIPLVDRVFTRIGAGDNISQGQSTFMVEMSEVSAILRQATPSSLVLLDEVGRGTSTYDGMSLAWAIVENLIEQTQCSTVFATHYHELTQMAATAPGRICNFHVGVEHHPQSGLYFTYKLEPGPALKSYGIQVAQMAGLPSSLITRAQKILGTMESQRQKSIPKDRTKDVQTTKELPLFSTATEWS